jgi:hypothetical protein
LSATLVRHILERGFQIGHLLLGPFCPQVLCRISRL